MKTPEQYQPSEEEMEKAEKNMTEEEAKMSELRSKDYDNLFSDMKEKLKKGEYDLKLIGGHKKDIKAGDATHSGEYTTIYGKIGEHTISIGVSDGDKIYAGDIKGSIDGEDIIFIPKGKDLASDIFNNYLKVAKLQDNEIYKSRARTELMKESLRKKEEEYMKSPEYKQKEEKRMKDEETRKLAQQKEKEEKERKAKEAREKLKDII